MKLVEIGSRTINFDHVVKVVRQPMPYKSGSGRLQLRVVCVVGDDEVFSGAEMAALESFLRANLDHVCRSGPAPDYAAAEPTLPPSVGDREQRD